MRGRFNWYLYFSACIVNLMAFVSGIGYGWTSTSLPKLNGLDTTASNPLSENITIYQESWLTSLYSLGSAFTPFLTGFTSERIGRKKTLLLFGVPMVVSCVMMIFAKTIELMYLSRILLGIGNGCLFAVVPVYTGEIAEMQNRGCINVLMGVIQCIGTLFVLVIGPFVSISSMAIIMTVPAVLFLVTGFIFLPESPYYLVSVGDKEAAKLALLKVRTTQDVSKELEDIVRNVEEHQANKFSVLSLFRNRILMKTLAITNIFFIFHHCSGIVGIMGYLQLIFSAAGTTIPAHYSAMIVSFVQVCTILVTSLLIDRIGRCVLVYISVSGICLAYVPLGVYFYCRENDYDVDAFYWVPLTCLMVYIVSFTCGLGPVIWTLIGELYPHNVKAFASTVTVSFCLFLAFFVSQFFPILIVKMGMSNLLFSMAFCCSWAILFVRFFVPETKGKSFQEIQDALKGGKR